MLVRPDGSEGGAHPLFEGINVVGRGRAHCSTPIASYRRSIYAARSQAVGLSSVMPAV